MIALVLAPLRLEAPSPQRVRARALRPQDWQQQVEALTLEHRKQRSEQLKERGWERAEEAFLVLARLTEAAEAEQGMGPLHPMRELHPADDRSRDKALDDELGPLAAEFITRRDENEGVAKILRRWDCELKASSRGRRRLIRGGAQPHDSWRADVIEECHRRIESTWHSSRAQAQLERFERVRQCGKKSRGWITCGVCGHAATELKSWCENHYSCRTCRDRRKSKLRRKFRRSREAALQSVIAAKLAPKQVRSDPMQERFLTLTMPRVPEEAGGAQAAVEIVAKAWSIFWDRLRAYWSRKVDTARMEQIRFVRVLEATAGRDALGHVHIHCWLIAPYARVEVIRWFWGQALISAGYEPDRDNPDHWVSKREIIERLLVTADAVPESQTTLRDGLRSAAASIKQRGKQFLFWPRIDVRKVYTKTNRVSGADGDRAADLADELIKYLVKDLGGLGNTVLMPAATWAAIYRGLDGRRALTTSRGFWSAVRKSGCPCCSARYSWELHAPPDAPAEPLRERSCGPPPQLLPSSGST